LSKAGIKRLEETMGYLAALIPIYPSRMDTLDLLADPRRGTDYDGNTRAPGHSDPVPAQAAQLEPHHRRQQAIRDNEVLLLHHAKMLYALINGIPNDIDTKSLVRQFQCQGGKLSAIDPADPMEGWRIDGLCEALYDTRDFLCKRCYQRRWKWGKESEGVAA
jgi:hypothetical protein